MKSRIDYLDGLRGVAILLVIAYHAYARWPMLVPYGDTYQNFPFFKLGWIGVQLFFILSGFVIFMTLDNTDSFKAFLYKRWLRLFPTMLLASILIYFTSFMFSARPTGYPNLLNLLPGLTFIDPYWWSKLIGIEVKSLEGAFWSLYVEFKFYVLAGLCYFYLGRKFLVPFLFILFIGFQLVSYIPEKESMKFINIVYKICVNLSFEYFGWFTTGALFYLYYRSNRECYFLMAVTVGILSALFINGIAPSIAALIVTSLFAASLKVQIIQKLLANKGIVFFGFISYPLYLIHESAMISMIVNFSDYLPWLNMFFYPFIPIAILAVVSFFIASKYEAMIKSKIQVIKCSMVKKIPFRTR